MDSLYNISNNLRSLFEEIEDNDGEITDEQYKELTITEENLQTKLDNYAKAIKIWEADAETCKKEKQRINDVQNKYKNRIARLKDSILSAVNEFGQNGKTNKFIECPTFRFSTRKATSIEEDGYRVEILTNAFHQIVDELSNNGVPFTGENLDAEGILEVINANCIAEYGEDFLPYTMSDLVTLNVDVTVNLSLIQLLRNAGSVLDFIAHNPTYSAINPNTDKTQYKTSIGLIRNMDDKPLTIAKEVNKESIIIK